MILASASPRRSQLLSEVGLTFRIIPANIDESSISAPNPVALVERLAYAKALEVASKAEPGEVVVGADTLVWIGDAQLGKPASDEEACEMLRRLSGKTHHVSTGCAFFKRPSDPVAATDNPCLWPHRIFSNTCAVKFYQLTAQQIQAYVATGEPRDKAGAYGIQGLGSLLVEEIQGNYDTVVGLPVAHLVRELNEFAPELVAPLLTF